MKLSFGTTLPTGVSEGTTKETVISITDDDVPSVSVEFGSATYSVDETDDTSTTEDKENEAVVTVTLSEDPERTVTIPIVKTNLGGASSSDYSGVPNNVVFNSGDTSKTFTFSATADSVDDDGESVRLTFGTTLPAGVTEGTTNESVISITDDDVPSVSVEFGSATYSVEESDDTDTREDKENEVTIAVTLSADPERTVTIPIVKANQGGATSSDYSDVPASVVFNSGDTSKTFTFSATADTIDDDGESVKLTFGTLPMGVTEGNVKETVVSINDDDATSQLQMSVTVFYKSSAYSLMEGSSITVTVRLSEDPERTVTIPVTTTNGTGASASDYSGVPENVVFNSGDTETSFSFTATQDSHDEDEETVTLGFGDMPSGVSTAIPVQVAISIRDSLRVSFGASMYEAHEGGDGAIVVVQLNEAASVTTTIPIEVTLINGVTTNDFDGVPSDVVFNAGEDSKSFTVTAIDDDIEDDGEMITLGFGDLPAGVIAEEPTVTTIELMNTEIDPNSIRCPDDSGARIILDAYGEITQAGDSQFWRLQLDPYRTYLIEVFGSSSQTDLNGDELPNETRTLPNAMVISFQTGDRSEEITRTPLGNAVDLVRGSDATGWHQIEVSGMGETGTYRIRVRVNNVCVVSNNRARYRYFGGPDGYVLDIPADIETTRGLDTRHVSTESFLGDNWSWYWDREPDVDWYEAASLRMDQEYNIVAWGPDGFSSRDQATDLKIIGVYDSGGNLISDTTTSTGKRVSIRFEPDSDGTYYIAVGSGSRDRTGVYKVKIEASTGSDNNTQGENNSDQNGEGNDRPRSDREGLEDGGQDNKSDSQRANTPATGVSTVTGTPQVGETLTADTSGIADDNGLDNATFRYQWLADGSSISGATSSSYTLTSAEEGKRIKVRVSFTDDAGHQETLTSTATSTVDPEPSDPDPEPPLAPQNLTATENEDGSITLTWDAPDDDSITGYQILRRRPGMDEDALLVYVQNTGTTATTYTDTNVTPGSRHVYRVKAINAAGAGDHSNFARIDP